VTFGPPLNPGTGSVTVGPGLSGSILGFWLEQPSAWTMTRLRANSAVRRRFTTSTRTQGVVEVVVAADSEFGVVGVVGVVPSGPGTTTLAPSGRIQKVTLPSSIARSWA
jgi:hypothetical protein